MDALRRVITKNMQDHYTPEQVKEVQEREKKALEYLKENHLTPAAIVEKINIGKDMFVDRVRCFLNDTKYAAKESPIKKDELAKKDR